MGSESEYPIEELLHPEYVSCRFRVYLTTPAEFLTVKTKGTSPLAGNRRAFRSVFVVLM